VNSVRRIPYGTSLKRAGSRSPGGCGGERITFSSAPNFLSRGCLEGMRGLAEQRRRPAPRTATLPASPDGGAGRRAPQSAGCPERSGKSFRSLPVTPGREFLRPLLRGPPPKHGLSSPLRSFRGSLAAGNVSQGKQSRASGVCAEAGSTYRKQVGGWADLIFARPEPIP